MKQKHMRLTAVSHCKTSHVKMINAKNYEFRLKRMEKMMIIKRRAMGYLLTPLCYLLLSACGGGGGDSVPAPVTPTPVALTSVDGTWTSNCVVDGATSSKSTLTNTNGTGSGFEQTYSDTNCTTTSGMQGAEYTYTLGSAITVDGTVDGITSATKIDITYTSGKTGSEFNIVAIKDSNTMYFGEDSGTNDGSTDALRPTQLDGSEKYTKQSVTPITPVALTSVDGTWLSNCVVEGATSSKITLINTNGTGSIAAETYSDAICTTVSVITPAVSYTYTLGSAITVDGTVDGITSATKIDIAFAGGVLPAEFQIVAIKDLNTMYFGDDSGTNNGTSDALRPTQLDGNIKFTKQ